MNSLINSLNQRLADRLGSVCGGSQPRFKWCYAPDEHYFSYDLDDRTLLKRSWASVPGPNGQPIGRVYLLAQWQPSNAYDHMGYGTGARIPFIKSHLYLPQFETALAPGRVPTEALTANYCWAIGQQLAMSLEHRKDSFEQHLAEQKYVMDKQEKRFANEHLEASMGEYDKHTGAFSNLEPGKRDGYFAFQKSESGDGFLPWESPVVSKISDTAAEPQSA